MTITSKAFSSPRTTKDDYLHGEVLISQRKLKEAAAHCQQMMASHPQDPYGAFLLARIYQETGNVDKALEYSNKAIALSEFNDPLFHCVRGSLLLGKHLLNEAEEDLRLAYQLDTGLGLAPLLLATIAINRREFDQAHRFLDEAGALGLHYEAAEQLGVLLIAEGKLEEALKSFNHLLEGRPDYALGYYHRAKLNFTRKDWDQAEQDAKKALALNPKLEESLRLLAALASHRNDSNTAIDYLSHALKINPHSAQLWGMLGHEFLCSGFVDESLSALNQALVCDSKNLYATNYIPYLLLLQGKDTEAKIFVDQALVTFPGNPILSHFKAYLHGETPACAGADYIQTLYDENAEKYDVSLIGHLNYTMPSAMAEAIQLVLARSDKVMPKLSLLDLGCGTGLGALALQSMTTRRVGIDLSEKMLVKAQDRKIYEELKQSDIVSYLNTTNDQFDLIIALEVLVYVGDLVPILIAVRNAMKRDGLFAFTVEAAPDEDLDYILTRSGRFCHSASYLRRIAEQFGFFIALFSPIHGRYELQKPVQSYLLILSDSSTHSE